MRDFRFLGAESVLEKQCLHCQEAYSKENTQRELHKVCTVQKGKVGHLSREEKG